MLSLADFSFHATGDTKSTYKSCEWICFWQTFYLFDKEYLISSLDVTWSCFNILVDGKMANINQKFDILLLPASLQNGHQGKFIIISIIWKLSPNHVVHCADSNWLTTPLVYSRL